MNKKTTFFLVRHGETEWNTKQIVQGISDSPLTANGKRQAKMLADKFNGIKFDLVISSDLPRAKSTAEILASGKEVSVITDKLLRERKFGSLEGKKHSDLDGIHKTISNLADDERYLYKHSAEYESDKEVIARFNDFIKNTTSFHSNKTILVVTHGAFMRMALMRIGFGNYRNLIPGSVSNTGWVKFDSDGTNFFVMDHDGIKKHE